MQIEDINDAKAEVVGDDWKAKYLSVLMEQEDAEKSNQEQVLQLYNELLVAFRHFSGKNETLDADLAKLPKKSSAIDIPMDSLKGLNRQIANIIDLEGDAQSDDQQEQTIEQGTGSITHDSLQYLIEQLPVEISEKVNSALVKRAASNGFTAESLRVVIDNINDVLNGALDTRNEKIEALSMFLGAVATRLNSLQTHLKEEQSDRKDSQADRGDLSSLVNTNLEFIRNSVAEADSLDNLQQVIETSLDEVGSKVKGFVETESDRADKAEKSSAALEQQLQQLEGESAQLRESLEAAISDAMIDPLTEVSNRRAYDERFRIEHARWQREQHPLSLAILDIDNFKHINDNYGHPVGDRVLQVVAKRIQEKVRESDFFGRIGGEEFALILVNSDIKNSIEKVEILRKVIENCHFSIKKKKFQVTMSIGLATFTGKDSLDSVYSRADQSLLKAKESGRNKVLSELDL